MKIYLTIKLVPIIMNLSCGWTWQSHGNSSTYSFQHLGPHYRTGGGQSYSVPTKALVDSYWTLRR